MVQNRRNLKMLVLLLAALVVVFASCDFSIDFFGKDDKLAAVEENPGNAAAPDQRPGQEGGSGNSDSSSSDSGNDGSSSGDGSDGSGKPSDSAGGNDGDSGSGAVPDSSDNGENSGDSNGGSSVPEIPGSGGDSDGEEVPSGGGEPVPDSPSSPPPQQETVEQSVADWSSFQSALTGSSVDTINLTGGISTATARPSGDVVLVMGNPDRDTVINGNGSEMSLDYAGIILAGNVTLNNVVLNFRNGVRNCIVANGYTLTLNQVRTSSHYSIHLFCGEITNHSLGSLPPAGSHGKIVVQGTNNQLGNIYAGSLDDAPNASRAANNDFKGAASIIVEEGVSFNSLGSIYAHGARELRGTGNGDALVSSPDKYRCSGGVVVSMESRLPSNSEIDGRTGNSTNATLKYTENGNGYSYSPVLKELGTLELVAGSAKPHLVPSSGSSFAAGASLSLPANTKLYLTSLEEDKSFDFSSLAGGGLLVLKAHQSVTIAGNVSGKTRLAINGVSYDESESTGTVIKGHRYIVAARSTDSSFVLLPPSSDDTVTLERSVNGEWSVPSTTVATTTKVSSFSLNSPGTVTAGVYEVSIPVTVSYSNGSYLSDIPAEITVNGSPAISSYDDSFGYEYTVTVGSNSFGIYFTTSDGVDEVLSICDNNGTPLSGTYKLEVTIPSGNTVNGQELKSTIDFTVN